MVLAEIGTAGVISAYFFRHMTSDPIERQPVQLSDYLFVFGCGLVFWLLVLLRAKLHGSGDRQADIRKVAKLAKLITPITTLNLCGGLLAPFMKLPLLVRFLVLFQVSSNLALLLIWAFLSLKECMILPDTHTPQKSSPELSKSIQHGRSSFPIQHGRSSLPNSKPRGHRNTSIFKKLFELVSNFLSSSFEGLRRRYWRRYEPLPHHLFSLDSFNAKVDKAGGSGSGHGSGASGKEANAIANSSIANSTIASRGGGGDRGESGSGHGSGASGSGENSGGYGGHGRDEGGTGSGHGSGAGGSGKNSGGSEGGDGVGGDPEGGGRGTNKEQAFKSSKITEMSLMLTAQTTSGGHGSGASGSVENSGGYGGHGRDVGGTGSGHGSGAGGSGENSGGNEGHGQDERETGSGHGSGAGGSGENSGGSEGGNGVGGDLEGGGSGANNEQAFKSSKISEMSLMLTAQITGTLIGFHTIPGPSSSSEALLRGALMVQLVAYLCGLTSILLSSNKPEDSKAAKTFAHIGFVCTALGFILMVAMFVTSYFVLIAVLLFVVVWLIFFRFRLRTCATNVWNYLKNSTQSIKNCIGMLFESGS